MIDDDGEYGYPYLPQEEKLAANRQMNGWMRQSLDNLPTPPKPTPQELNAIAIDMRFKGQFYKYFGGLGGKGGPVYIGDWLRMSFEKYGYDKKDMAQL